MWDLVGLCTDFLLGMNDFRRNNYLFFYPFQNVLKDANHDTETSATLSRVFAHPILNLMNLITTDLTPP